MAGRQSRVFGSIAFVSLFPFFGVRVIGLGGEWSSSFGNVCEQLARIKLCTNNSLFIGRLFIGLFIGNLFGVLLMRDFINEAHQDFAKNGM